MKKIADSEGRAVIFMFTRRQQGYTRALLLQAAVVSGAAGAASPGSARHQRRPWRATGEGCMLPRPRRDTEVYRVQPFITYVRL